MSFLKNKQVERILSQYPETRGNDRLLILRVWETLGLGFSQSQRKLFLSARVPSPETIRRTRQKLQEAGKYRPDEGTVNQRKKLANETKNESVEDKQLKMLDDNYVRKTRRIYGNDSLK